MRTFSRYVIAGACIAAFAFPASAQFNAGAPWGQHALDRVTITSTDRTVVYDDIAHYRYRVQVGAGPYDMVQVHRVVREAEPWKPKGHCGGSIPAAGTSSVL
jgi:transcriptional regulator of nitric oxide reductase